MVNISETCGLWERSLIAWPDGREDRTTRVAWLQGQRIFADLRQPAAPPSFEGVSCLEDLDAEHCLWLATQEGFAGRLVHAGEAFEWQRAVDFQCPGDAVDAGYLDFADGMMIERGRDIPYIEHWHHTSAGSDPRFAAELRDADGVSGFVVRVGDIFMYVRDRTAPLPHGGSLTELVAQASPAIARGLLDCEISLGRVRGGLWLIGRSSLPFRVGSDLGLARSGYDRRVTVHDVTADGMPTTRQWTIVDLDVDSDVASGANA
jgi:hypothetical protein